MTPVIGVRFKRAGKIYYFSPGDLHLELGQNVLVETSRGIELGEVAEAVKLVPDEEVVQPLKQVVRVATQRDMVQVDSNRDEEHEAFLVALRKIQEHALEMKLVDVEYTFDRSKLVFYFTSEKRVDFRELVKDLASCFRTRIELRQIGVRDEAKMVGGLGVCGRSLCCTAWMSEFEPVSIRQAKDQDLAMNPNKISGVCGRLKCCLRFESDAYEDARAVLPKLGERVMTPAGEGRVVALHVLRNQYVVQTDEGPRFVLGLPDNAPADSPADAGKEKPAGTPCAGCAGCPPQQGQAAANNQRSKRNNRPRPVADIGLETAKDKAAEEIAAAMNDDDNSVAAKKRKRRPKRRPKDPEAAGRKGENSPDA